LRLNISPHRCALFIYLVLTVYNSAQILQATTTIHSYRAINCPGVPHPLPSSAAAPSQAGASDDARTRNGPTKRAVGTRARAGVGLRAGTSVLPITVAAWGQEFFLLLRRLLRPSNQPVRLVIAPPPPAPTRYSTRRKRKHRTLR